MGSLEIPLDEGFVKDWMGLVCQGVEEIFRRNFSPLRRKKSVLVNLPDSVQPTG